jgi:FKBP-type peptidyl-prolyl cis-trans isomerase
MFSNGRFKVFAAALLTLTLAACSKHDAPRTTYDLSAASNTKFLADNKAKEGVRTTPTGLQYRVIKAGSGAGVTSGGDMVTVMYKGWTIDGKVFDQTQPGQTAQFPAGQLIPGWVEALRMMHEGDEWELVIPSDLGYGPNGTPDGSIGPNQTLVFDMTLVSIQPAAPPQ